MPLLDEDSPLDEKIEAEPIELSEDDEVKADSSEAPPPKDEMPEWAKGLVSTVNELKAANSYYKGRLDSIERGEEKPAPKADEPKAPEALSFNIDELQADLDKRGAAALNEFVAKVSENAAARAAFETEKRLRGDVNATLQSRDAEARYNQAMGREMSYITSNFADVWDNEDFKAEADQEAAAILSERLGRDVSQIDFSNPRNLRLFQPGDLRAAASTVYARWLKSGKVKLDASGSSAKPSLREIVRTVSNEPNGTRRSGTNGPTSIDDLDMSEEEKRAAKATAKRLGVSDAEWIKYAREEAA